MRDKARGRLPRMRESVVRLEKRDLALELPPEAGGAIARFAVGGREVLKPLPSAPSGSGKSDYGAREQGFAAVELYTQTKTAYSWA